MDAVTIDLEVIHADDRDDVVDDTTAETDLLDELATVGVHPVSQKLGLFR